MAKSKLVRMAKCKVLLVLLTAALPFLLFIFPYRTETLKAVICKDKPAPCKDNPTLDSDPCYDSEEAYALIRKFDSPSRQLYAWTEITVDMIFPIIYSLLLSLLIIYIFQKSSNKTTYESLAMLPFIAMLFDYCENVLIAVMLFDYQREHFALARVASLATKLKFSFLAVSLAAILFGLIWLAIRSLSKESKTH
jgi:hypothetical protein